MKEIEQKITKLTLLCIGVFTIIINTRWWV